MKLCKESLKCHVYVIHEVHEMNGEQGKDLDLDDKILQEEQDISTADAVSLFNTSLAKALAQQKEEILGELRKTQSTEPVPGPSSVTSKNYENPQLKDSNACQPKTFEFKQKGTKIQFNFNTERIATLKNIESLVREGKNKEIEQIIKSEIITLNQRNNSDSFIKTLIQRNLMTH